MPYSPGGIRVNPNGQTAVVTFALPNGGVPVAYDSASGSGTVSLPATITVPTTFYFQEKTTVVVSALVGTTQVATAAGATAAVDLSGGGVATLTCSVAPAGGSQVAPLSPAVSAVTRDSIGRLTGFTDGFGNVYSAITRDASGLVTSFAVNGTTHTVTRDSSTLLVTGVS